jgi:hypothetical protein
MGNVQEKSSAPESGYSTGNTTVSSQSNVPETNRQLLPLILNFDQVKDLEGSPEKQAEFKKAFYLHGCVLVKKCFDPSLGDPENIAAQFEAILSSSFKMESVPNLGDASRDRITSIGSTFATSESRVAIPLHSELGYVKNPPRFIAFGCGIPAPEGGAMILGDSRKIHSRIPPALLAKLEERGAYCCGTYSPNHWKTVLFTPEGDISVAEAHMEELGWTWSWNPDGSLSWWSSLPGTHLHPVTGEKVFLPSTHFLQAFRTNKGKPKLFGDHSEMTLEEFRELRNVHKKSEVEVMLVPGDIIILDNYLIKHGRRSFEGNRKHYLMISNKFIV